MKKSNLLLLLVVSLNLAVIFTLPAQTFYDDFEHGKISSPWKSEGSDTKINTEMSLSGKYAFKAYMTPKVYSNARSEIKFTGADGIPFFHKLLTVYGVQVAIYVPEDFQPDNTSSEIILQYHGKPDSHDTYKNPPFAVYLQGSNIRVTARWYPKDPGANDDQVTNSYSNLAKVEPGKWHFFVIDINWDYRSSGNGYAKVYMKKGSPPSKSDMILDHRGPIGSKDQEGPYFKMGIYKWDWKKQSKVDQAKAAGITHRTLYFDNISIKEGGILTGSEPSNNPPSVNAGSNKTITLPANSVTLSGSASDDKGISKVSWIKVSGGQATIVSSNNTKTDITNLEEGNYTFRLTATDTDGVSSSDDVNVTVIQPNSAPEVDAGQDYVLTLPVNTLTVKGQASDRDGTVEKVNWTVESGGPASIVSPGSLETVIKDLVEGETVLRLAATDDDGTVAHDFMKITVLPEPVNAKPVVNAGADKNITLPVNTVTFNGSTSDPDGSISRVEWTKVNGGNATILSPDKNSTTIENLEEGTYTFRLTAWDNAGASASDNVFVTVLAEPVNERPVVNAGPDKEITLPVNSVTVNGSATDNDGSITEVTWSKANGGAATIENPNNLSTTISGLVEGTYTFRLTARDNSGETSSDIVVVTVLPEPPNALPVVNAGADRQIALPQNSVQLNGTANDTDGTIASTAWSKVSGGPATITNPANLSTDITGLTEGTYTFRLTATDNKGGKKSDDVKVTVLPEAANIAPVVDAGANKTITLPVNTVELSASVSDPDGTITKIQWSKTNGGPAAIASPGKKTTQVNGLTEGSYTFRITATDDKGDATSDQVTVTVLPEPAVANVPPVVNAGADKTITLPVNQVQLAATANDPDGSVSSVQWSKVDGGTATIETPGKLNTVISGLTEGAYTFMVTVTDNNGASASDRVDIDVLGEVVIPNEKPVVNAGSDQIILYPENAVDLKGTASDPDGSIASVQWAEMSGADVTILNADELNARVENLVAGEYFFRLTATDNEGLSASAEVMITVEGENQPPVVELAGAESITLPLESYEITALASDPDGEVVSYEWIQDKGPELILMQTATPTLRMEEIAVGNYEFTLVVTDNDGAKTEATIRLKASLDMNKVAGLPRVFSPDGNGIDDFWILKDPSVIENCDMVIFNRQGKKVYESESYANDWDGTLNGRPLPEGDYYYVIKCDDGGEPLTGGVRILRQ